VRSSRLSSVPLCGTVEGAFTRVTTSPSSLLSSFVATLSNASSLDGAAVPFGPVQTRTG
jgi:hypothetical protein